MENNCARCGFTPKTHLYVLVVCEMCERPMCLDCWEFIGENTDEEYKVCKSCLSAS